MSFFDLALVILLGAFVLYGLWFGLIHALGALVGVIAGAFIAGRLFDPLAHSFSWVFGGNVNLGRVVVFFIVFTIANRLVGLVFHLLERAFKVLTVLPFLSSINRLAGAILGFLEGSLVLGGALLLATKFPIAPGLTTAIAQSQIAAYLLGVASVIVPLLPELVRQLESALPKKVF
ncbi:MAG: CvpA family protein [bacterium]|nr:CvpA family protein [bacterium]